MGDDNANIDFSLVDTDLVRSPNDIPDDLDNPYTVQTDQLDTNIPESHEDAYEDNRPNTGINGDIIRLLLDEAGKTAGIKITDHMSVTATALAHNIGFNPNSMDWFLAGMSYANNALLTEKMSSSIKDLQVEIRNLQNAAFSVGSITSEFMGKMSRQKREILDEMDKTRESVLATLRECSAISTATKDIIDDAEDLSGYVDETVVPEVGDPKPVDPVLSSPGLTTHINTKSPEDILYSRKEKVLRDVGFSTKDIKSIGVGGVDVLVTDEILDLSESGWTTEQRDEAFAEMIEVAMEVGLMS